MPGARVGDRCQQELTLIESRSDPLVTRGGCRLDRTVSPRDPHHRVLPLSAAAGLPGRIQAVERPRYKALDRPGKAAGKVLLLRLGGKRFDQLPAGPLGPFSKVAVEQVVGAHPNHLRVETIDELQADMVAAARFASG